MSRNVLYAVAASLLATSAIAARSVSALAAERIWPRAVRIEQWPTCEPLAPRRVSTLRVSAAIGWPSAPVALRCTAILLLHRQIGVARGPMPDWRYCVFTSGS